MPRLILALAFLTLPFIPAAHADDDDGWVSLFNGKDLSNWVNVNCAPETWRVEDGVIKCTGKPTGALRTPRMYENFVMEVEWRHMRSGGNAGIFIWSSPIAAKGVPFLRAIEVQVLDHGYGNTANYTTHGDVFPIHGATMNPIGRHNGMRSFPSENRSKPSPEWNHYRIEGRDGSLRLSVNGKEVSGGDQCNWRKGYLGLESEGAPTEWRVVRIKELPPAASVPPDASAPEALGHRQLYNGLDLRGWKTETPDRWLPSDWQLRVRKGNAGKPLWTDSQFGDAEFIVDVKIDKNFRGHPALLLQGSDGKDFSMPLDALIPQSGSEAPKGVQWGQWNRLTLTVKGSTARLESNGEILEEKSFPPGFPAKRALGLADPAASDPAAADSAAAITFGNLYARDL